MKAPPNSTLMVATAIFVHRTLVPDANLAPKPVESKNAAAIVGSSSS